MNQNVRLAQDLIASAIAVMARVPDDFVPREDPAGRTISPGDGLSEAGIPPASMETLRATYEAWPDGLLRGFHQTTDILAQVLRMFGAPGRIDPFQHLASLRPEDLSVLSAAASLPVGRDETSAEVLSPAMMRSAVIGEIERRLMNRHTPFSATVTTMLGPDALRWLFAPNSSGTPYLQPHEFSRAGWIRLSRVGHQLEIEQELLRLGAEHAAHARIVVCLAWTAAALASLMEPEVFLTERNSFVSSARNAGITVSRGLSNHTVVNFAPRSLRDVLHVLHEGLASELMSACDLMWIANSVARVRSIAAGPEDEQPEPQNSFDVFLSHRGCDAKRHLLQALLGPPATRGVFLDCLTLPRGVVNRSFVFGAIGRSREVVVVDTPNYRESAWCLKELWFAEQLAKLGKVTLRQSSLDETIQTMPRTGPNGPAHAADRSYPIAGRVLSDLRYWARSPNLDSLAKLRPVPEPFQYAEQIARRAAAAADAAAPDTTAREVMSLFENAAMEARSGDSVDLWASALQLGAAILGAGVNARSKMEIRAGVDRLNAALLRMIETKLFEERVFVRRRSRYLACMAGVLVSDLAGLRLDQRTADAIRGAVGGVATLHDGLLLFDVRRPGAERDFLVRFAMTLLTHDLSAVGILQNADDPVHQLQVDGQSLEVLPCITLHPGMEELFVLSSASQSSSSVEGP